MTACGIWSEWILSYTSADGGTSTRPLAVVVNRATHGAIGSMAGEFNVLTSNGVTQLMKVGDGTSLTQFYTDIYAEHNVDGFAYAPILLNNSTGTSASVGAIYGQDQSTRYLNVGVYNSGYANSTDLALSAAFLVASGLTKGLQFIVVGAAPIVLLFAPLARAALTGPGNLRDSLAGVLRSLTVDDAREAYAAIRLAAPGGLEAEVEHDVRAEPTITLREAMASATHRDNIAAEYVSDYALTFERGLPALPSNLAQGLTTDQAVVQTYLGLLAAVPDTLIARKQGMAQAVSNQAIQVLAAGGVFSAEGRRAIAALDTYLRRPDNRLNPGTTAGIQSFVTTSFKMIGKLNLWNQYPNQH